MPLSDILSDGARQWIDGSGVAAVRRNAGTLTAEPGEPGADSDDRIIQPGPGRQAPLHCFGTGRLPARMHGGPGGCNQRRPFQPPVPRFSRPDDNVSRKNDPVV